MKTVRYLFILLIFSACNPDGNCLKSAGDDMMQTMETAPFHTIDIPKGIEVEIMQNNEYQVDIYSFKNRIEQITTQVKDSVLTIENLNNCDLIHRQKVAKITIHTPTLHTIKSRTQFRIYSADTLTFPNIFIISSLPENSSSSEIDLIFDNQSISIEDNKVAYFKLSGKTQRFIVSLYGGSPAVDARNLLANEVYFYHRSSNNIHLNPLDFIEGTLASTGNAILYHKAANENISSTYKGKVEYRIP